MKKNKDLIGGLVFLVIGIIYMISSFFIQHYSGYGGESVDSAFVPKLLGVMMIVLSACLCVKALKRKDVSEEVVEETDDDAVKKTADNRAFFMVLGILILYVALIVPLGFLPSTALFLGATIFVLTPKEKRQIPLMIGLPVVVSIGVYFLFVDVLGLLLPMGIMPF